MATYYVDNLAGKDANAGTSPGAAWKTVAKLNGFTFSAGDTILLKRDCLWREMWTLANSGSAGNVITIDAYGAGNNPQIAGTDVLTGWTLNSGSIYQANYTNAITTRLLIQDGIIATLVGSLGAIVAAGQFYADDSAHIIYYWSTDSASPNTHVMEIGGRNNCLDISACSYLTINNLHLHGAGGSSGGCLKCAPASAATSHVTLNNVEADYAHYVGIWFDPFAGTPSDTITIGNCLVHNCNTLGVFIDGQDTTHKFTNVSVTGNHIYSNGDTVIGQHGCFIQHTQSVSVTSNEIDHNSGYLDWSGGLYLVDSPGATVKYNKVHDNHWANIHFDVNSNSFDCEYNVSWNAVHNGFWVEEHLRINGTSLLAHNLAFNDICPFYLGPGSTIHTVSGLTVVDNLFVQGQTRAAGIDCSTGGVTSNYFDNTIDRNFYTITGGGTALFQTVTPNANYTTLASWQALTGFDAHSQNADPLFTRYASDGTGNYQLSPTSPAIGAAVVTSSDPSTDYNGSACPQNGRYDCGPLMFNPKWRGF